MIICADGFTLTGQSTMSLANPTNLSWMTPQNGAWITAWLQMLIDLQQYTLPTSTHVMKHHFLWEISVILTQTTQKQTKFLGRTLDLRSSSQHLMTMPADLQNLYNSIELVFFDRILIPNPQYQLWQSAMLKSRAITKSRAEVCSSSLLLFNRNLDGKTARSYSTGISCFMHKMRPF